MLFDWNISSWRDEKWFRFQKIMIPIPFSKPKRLESEIDMWSPLEVFIAMLCLGQGEHQGKPVKAATAAAADGCSCLQRHLHVMCSSTSPCPSLYCFCCSLTYFRPRQCQPLYSCAVVGWSFLLQWGARLSFEKTGYWRAAGLCRCCPFCSCSACQIEQ